MGLRTPLIEYERVVKRLVKVSKALADKADAVGDCDHKRASCAEVGCIGEQVKAVREAIADAEKLKQAN